MAIHPTAIIDPSAEIDSSANIGPFSIVGPRVTVGPNVEIMGHGFIDKDTEIGEGSRIFPFASVGADPQDLKYKGERTRLVIGRQVTIRESTTIHRGTAGGGGLTEIGDGCLIMSTVHVAHDCRLGPEVILSSYVVLAGHISIGRGASIGGLSAIHQFARVGEYAFLGGGSTLNKDMPPYMAGASSGTRDLLLTGPNVVGFRRRGLPESTIEALSGAFKIICRNHTPLPQVLAEAEAAFPDVAEVKTLIEFYRTSERGTYR